MLEQVSGDRIETSSQSAIPSHGLNHKQQHLCFGSTTAGCSWLPWPCSHKYTMTGISGNRNNTMVTFLRRRRRFSLAASLSQHITSTGATSGPKSVKSITSWCLWLYELAQLTSLERCEAAVSHPPPPPPRSTTLHLLL